MDLENIHTTFSIETIKTNLNKTIKSSINFKIIIVDSKSLKKSKEFASSQITNINTLHNPLNYQRYQNNFHEIFDSQNQLNQLDILLYDAFLLQDVYRDFLNLDFNDSSTLILTDKLIATFDESDARYHARTIVFGRPTIISLTGIIMGPARPRDYYLKRIFYQDNPDLLNLIDSQYREKFIDHNDSRMNTAIFIYLLQYFFYIINNNFDFCKNKRCFLYNCHWQEELLYLVEYGGLCQIHIIYLNKSL